MVSAEIVTCINVSIYISFCIRVVFCKSDVSICTLVDKAIALLLIDVRFCLIVPVLFFSICIIIGRNSYLQEVIIIESMTSIQCFSLLCCIAVIVQFGLRVGSVIGNSALCRKGVIEGIIVNGRSDKIKLICHGQLQSKISILLLATPGDRLNAALFPDVLGKVIINPGI